MARLASPGGPSHKEWYVFIFCVRFCPRVAWEKPHTIEKENRSAGVCASVRSCRMICGSDATLRR
ncbi:MAG TPA: hypothetical protein PKK15_24675, partial [Kouleothrix sp.]|nr:hypothetical protein [Kouleothrix sp.]